ADALLECAPGVADVAAPDEGGPPGDRLGCVASERVAELREGEPPMLVLVEEAERGECTEKAVERARVGLRGLGELVARSRPVREQVGDPEHCSNVDRLRELVRVDEPAELGSVAQIVLNCSNGCRQLSQ